MLPESKTLAGLGPFLQSDLCPACRMLRDAAVSAPPSADIAFCYGVAVVYFRGVDATTQTLCTKHLGMVRALVREAKRPSGSGF